MVWYVCRVFWRAMGSGAILSFLCHTNSLRSCDTVLLLMLMLMLAGDGCHTNIADATGMRRAPGHQCRE